MTKTEFWTTAIPHFLFWLTPLALVVILTGCKDKPPCDGPNCPLPQEQINQTVLDQIEENGKAADGQDFIAAPPIGWKDPVEAQAMKAWRKDLQTRQVEDGKTVAETTK